MKRNLEPATIVARTMLFRDNNGAGADNSNIADGQLALFRYCIQNLSHAPLLLTFCSRFVNEGLILLELSR